MLTKRRDVMINIYTIVDYITSKAKLDMSIAMKSPFRAKHTNDSLFIDDLVRLRHYNTTLENSDIMLISH